MILKGSQRGGAKQLGLHLLKTEENEHVELHEVRGFMTDDVVGALREAEAISRGTRCKQFLFSVSLNPPPQENVRFETFKGAIEKIEKRNGLEGQPRVVLFHEKEGRRHCHAAWSRIDAETMTARHLPYFKKKLRETSKELYLENGWQMPRGLMASKARDPRNFTLDEWQQAKRIGRHARELKELVQECWAISDTRAAFAHALEERGLYLARGDRRRHVAVTFEGEVISVRRAVGKKAEDITARLGEPGELASVEKTRQRIAEKIAPRLKAHMDEARARAARELQPLDARRRAMHKQHAAERAKMDAGQQARREQEARARAQRLRKGVSGLWDRLTGRHAKTQKQNEMQALWALQRDREQRQAMVNAQLEERRRLQAEIREKRTRHAQALRELHSDLTNYRGMKRGEPPKPKMKAPPERLETQRQSKADQREKPLQRKADHKPAQRKGLEQRLEQHRKATSPTRRLPGRGRRLDRGRDFEPER